MQAKVGRITFRDYETWCRIVARRDRGSIRWAATAPRRHCDDATEHGVGHRPHRRHVRDSICITRVRQGEGICMSLLINKRDTKPALVSENITELFERAGALRSGWRLPLRNARTSWPPIE